MKIKNTLKRLKFFLISFFSKNRSYNNESKTIAVLYPSLLRQTKNFLQQLDIIKNYNSHVFICAHENEISTYNNLFKDLNFANFTIVNFDEHFDINNFHGDQIRIIQFLKLQLLIDFIIDKEAQEGIKFDNFFKLRQDYKFISKNFLKITYKNNDLFCKSDVVFASDRKTFLKLRSLYVFSCLTKDKINNIFPLNYNQIKNSDQIACKLEWLPKPKDKDFLKLNSQLSISKKTHDDHEHCARGGHSNYPAEVFFALYLNFTNIYAKYHHRLDGFIVREKK